MSRKGNNTVRDSLFIGRRELLCVWYVSEMISNWCTLEALAISPESTLTPAGDLQVSTLSVIIRRLYTCRGCSNEFFLLILNHSFALSRPVILFHRQQSRSYLLFPFNPSCQFLFGSAQWCVEFWQIIGEREKKKKKKFKQSKKSQLSKWDEN